MSDMYGSQLMPGRRWTPQVEISQNTVGQVPPGEFEVDPFLPVISVDPFDPAAAILIPAGRFVSVGYSTGRSGNTNFQTTLADTGRTPLTICDGLNLNPVGFSVNQMYRSMNTFMTDSNTVKFRKGFVAEVPYISGVNGAYGEVRSGDNLAAYWGSTTSVTNIATHHRGKPVKWVPRRVVAQSGTASAVWILTAAIYPGIVPSIVALTNNGTPVSPTQALSFNGTNWVLNLTGTGSGTVTHVIYEYGMAADQIAGQAIRTKSLSEIGSEDPLMRWVENAQFDTINFPPALPAARRYPVTPVTNQVPTQVSSNRFRVLNFPMSVHHPVTVQVRNVRITDGATGAATTYTSDWYTLPTGNTLDARGYFMGNFHTVNWRTGVIDLASNLTPVTGSLIDVRVSYSFISDNRDGAALWGGGILGLTDGSLLNNLGATANDGFGVSQRTVPTQGFGVQSQLNLPDVVGGLRLFVH